MKTTQTPIPFFPALWAWLISLYRLCVAWIAYHRTLIFMKKKVS